MEWKNKIFSEKEAMELACQEAEKGQGFVSPNPPVGSVILDKNKHFLSSGFYTHYGGIHAEIAALNKVQDKEKLKGAHLFVTLEPCSHKGQNPPCVDRLLKEPLASISYGIEDPNPKVKGKGGLERLKKQGFAVKKSPYCRKWMERLYEAFHFNMKERSCFFALKVASSLDGVMSLSHGESQWITGPEARDFVFRLRAGFDAILIGLGTFLEDNPRLNCRLKGLEKIQNKVCILDPQGQSLDLISKSALASLRPPENIFLISSETVKAQIKKTWPFQCLSLPFYSGSQRLDLRLLGQKLYEKKINSLLVEGGAKTLSSFLEQKLAKRMYHFINPSLFGGQKGRYWTENLSLSALSERKKLNSLESLFLGEDLLITGTL